VLGQAHAAARRARLLLHAFAAEAWLVRAVLTRATVDRLAGDALATALKSRSLPAALAAWRAAARLAPRLDGARLVEVAREEQGPQVRLREGGGVQ